MPKGPDGKAFPTIGYAGWSMLATSENKDLAWKLIATLEGPEGNVAWNKRTGALPVYKSAEKDPVLRRASSSRAGSRSSPTRTSVPTVMPTYLEEFAFFKDSHGRQDRPAGAARRASRRRSWPTQWADYLTKAQQKFLAKK